MMSLAMKCLTLSLVASAASAGIPCVDEPGVTLPGGWDCAHIAAYMAGSPDIHSCTWAGPWLSVMVAPRLAEEAAAKCPLSCNECAPDDVDAVDDRAAEPEEGEADAEPGEQQ